MSVFDLAAHDKNGGLTPQARATDDALSRFYDALTKIPKDEIIRRLNQANEKQQHQR